MCRRPSGVLQCEKETFPSGEEGSKEGGCFRKRCLSRGQKRWVILWEFEFRTGGKYSKLAEQFW